MSGWMAAAQIASSIIDNAMAYQNAERANRNNQINYKHRYRWQMQDMRLAGLNPILAATQGAGSMPGAPQAPVISTGKAMSSIGDYMNQRDLVNSAVEKNKADAYKATEEGKTVEATREGHVNVLSTTAQKNLSDMGVNNQRILEINKAMEQMDANISLTNQKTETSRQEVLKLEAETKLLDQRIEQNFPFTEAKILKERLNEVQESVVKLRSESAKLRSETKLIDTDQQLKQYKLDVKDRIESLVKEFQDNATNAYREGDTLKEFGWWMSGYILRVLQWLQN